MGYLTIDGSYGEGGGQLSRYAVALAAITRRPLRLVNIRSRRARPGLMPQHLAALRAAAAVGGGALYGDELGSIEVRFTPGRIRGGEYRFDVGTAGSVVLVLQALLPVALHADSPVELTVTGGTDVRMAPPLDYFRMIFLPWLARMGVRVHIQAARHGYYPRGGGLIRLRVEPCPSPSPLEAATPGRLVRIGGVSHVAHLPPDIAARMASAASCALAGYEPVQIEERRLGRGDAFGSGGALVLVAETGNSFLGSATVAQRGVPAEELGRQAGQSLRAELEAGAAMDTHACDQLLLYAAQAAGPSRLLVREVSEHSRTVMWLVEQFLPVSFRVETRQGLYPIEVAPG
ncbi:RNA 3'-terminal phosphate cyclase [Microbulbifer yueqingensis]|uniref:RNA 3'-terminal phosphate cyclase n=1 Tax=Microbulbifer yueqingensis TaxID=658219 RepID=A0A1G8VZ89_9GAMM|nr:RNA 3'-terminal phosphate cyclase [Microbulbifer yueqingensis]SDJ71428.1 RNA 3'-terminal phosphate cyclase (ATP) [Microbulbifer yueqingensis]